MQIKFISEIGQNHNGSIETAFKMVDEIHANNNGEVWAIKTAKRNVELHREEWEAQPYGDTNYYEHRKSLELSKEDFTRLKEYVESKGYIFTSSFTDLDSLNFLQNDLNLEWLKIASSRNVDSVLLSYIDDDKKIIHSNGMNNPIQNMVKKAFIGCMLQEKEKVIYLETTSAYPCNNNELSFNNLRYVDGVSLHTLDNKADLVSVACAMNMGKKEWYIERHITLDKTQKGTDHQLSFTPDYLPYYFDELRQVMSMFNNKQIMPSEQASIKKLRHDLI